MSAINAKLNDFKDWFSPMLVKELRQGTRTRAFTFAFILLQASLVIVMFMSLVEGSSAGEASGYFWFCICVAFLIIMPLRGYAALSGEMKGGTLDLILLTRLSAWKIAFGKWSALFSQTLLVAIALLPYVVLRYFLGGIDMINEAGWLLVLTVTSGVFTAITVGLSGQSSAIIRGIVAIGLVMLSFTVFGNFIVGSLMRGRFFSFSGNPDIWKFFYVFFLTAVFSVYYFLDMGATHFAPAAENHATRKRLIALLFVGLMLAGGFLGIDEEITISIAAVAAVFVLIDALTEHPAPVASIYVPFVRRGLAGRLAGRFLYPGWPTAVFFALVLGGILSWSFLDVAGMGGAEYWVFAIAFFGAVIFPVAIIQIGFNRSANQFSLYIFVQVITVLLISLVAAMDEGLNSDGQILWYLAPIPVAALFIEGNSYRFGAGDELLLVVSISTAVHFGVLVFKAFPILRKIGQLEKVVGERLDSEKAAFDGAAPPTATKGTFDVPAEVERVDPAAPPLNPDDPNDP
jgi:hypothetical protein